MVTQLTACLFSLSKKYDAVNCQKLLFLCANTDGKSKNVDYLVFVLYSLIFSVC